MRIRYQIVAACALLVLVMVMAEIAGICANSSTLLHSLCVERERQALVKFKASLNDSSNMLSSWHGDDCCRWKGIGCDNVTGHVVMLDLTTPYVKCRRSEAQIEYTPEEYDYEEVISSECNPFIDQYLEAGNVNSSLLELEYLTHLDLSGNHFCWSHIPMFIGSMHRLRYLSLSDAGFGGRIPSNLGNLTNLHFLDLSRNEFSPDSNINWISQLPLLEHLDMSHIYTWFQVDIINVTISAPKLQFLSLAHNRLNVSNLDALQNMTSLVHLDLSWCYLHGPIPNAFQNATSIEFFVLSGNNFDSLPSWFHKFKKLKHLFLSSNNFQGRIPDALRNMTSIESLSLSDNSFTSIPSWFIELKKLVYLSLSSNKLTTMECSVSSILENMCHLKWLYIARNRLRKESIGNNDLSTCIRHDLENLDLSENEFNDHLASWLGQLENLGSLYLHDNFFYGSIPSSFGKLLKLKILSLYNNKLEGDLPDFMGQRVNLQVVDLSNNSFNGTFTQNLEQLVNLQDFDISNNYLKGIIPQNLGQLVNLQNFVVSNNYLTGSIPSSLGQLINLTNLDLSNNYLKGIIPASLNQLVNLSFLDLSRNKLDGRICIDFQKLGVLSHLDLSSNNLNGPITGEKGWPLFIPEMWYLNLSHNHISGSLPDHIGHIMPNLRSLILGNNLINGSIPKSLCQLDLRVLDLSKNRISGEIPNCWKENGEWEEINLSSNKLTGAFPTSFGNLSTLSWLHLNNNSLHGEFLASMRNLPQLLIIDLGENQLSGTIPSWSANTFSSLQILRLRQNRLSGSIPSQICELSSIKILDLSRNNLNGSIPRCIGNLRGMTLEAPALSPTSSVAELHNSSLTQESGWTTEDVIEVIKGRELDYIRILKLVVIMDLSENNLVGSIPKGITLLNGLHSLNLSNNHLIGKIPNMIGDMRSLESFDVSSNQLSGTIPSSMLALTSLSHLYLSYNNFSGPIPTDNQFLTYDSSSYAGNPYLCGFPLPNKCGYLHEDHGSSEFEDDDSNLDKLEKWLFYFVIAIGFATGFWGVIGTLWFKKTWRHAYFRWVEDLADTIYVTTTIKMAKLKKWMMMRNRVVA
ncbi:receptor-like protein EIX2 [Arachis stenosperma]|uniref:receptor-like protein EIX2 n=1 Tax=Arachis stenosperma TaxID=217475 RepID=UPI0025AB8DE4|nr:receptor-like protein EIX2 [Arachis stenosperma]